MNEAAKVVPEFRLLPYIPNKDGITLSEIRINKLPHGGFRNIGEGEKSSRSDGTPFTSEAKFYYSPVDIVTAEITGAVDDIAVAEQALQTQGDLLNIAGQFYYGNDAKGFQGLAQLVPAEMTVKAVEAAPASYTSVYLVYYDTPKGMGKPRGVALHGSEKQGSGSYAKDVIKLDPPYWADRSDAEGGTRRVLCSRMGMWLGLALLHSKSVVKITHINEQNPLTPALLDKALELMPLGFARENLRFMMTAGVQRKYSDIAHTTDTLIANETETKDADGAAAGTTTTTTRVVSTTPGPLETQRGGVLFEITEAIKPNEAA